MRRLIKSFQLDRHQEWTATLECGHFLLMRHNPPYQDCGWVKSAQGRAQHLGDIEECISCDMPSLPQNICLVKKSEIYTHNTLPTKFFSEYEPKKEIWVKVLVTAGLAQFFIHTDPPKGFILDPMTFGVMCPGVSHSIKPSMGHINSCLEFYKSD